MMGKKSRKPNGRSRGGGRKVDAVVTAKTKDLLTNDEKIKKQYTDGTLTAKTLRIAVATALGVDEEGIKKTVKAALLAYMDEHRHEENEAATQRESDARIQAEIEKLKAENAELRADEISRATARAKATAKATPHKGYAANPQFSKAISNLIETIGQNEEDVEDFKEFLNSIKRRHYPGPIECVETIARWPRLRKYWPRLRRRICSYCGKGTFDLSAPRLLVCGGCYQGRGVGRYCSEDCQREHWPEHQKACMKLHIAWPSKSERDAYLAPFMKDLRQCKEKGLTLEEYLALGGTEAERLRLARSGNA